MRNDQSSSDNMRRERRDSGTVSTELTAQGSERLANGNPPKPFKPKRINLTPDEPVNVGHLGGVRRPKKQNQ
jgi:hypothetical protein